MATLLTVAETARRLAIPTSSAYELIRQKLLPCVYVGRSIRVNEAALDEWIAVGGRRFDGGWRKNGNS